MIVPIGHDQAVQRWPWVTFAIIAICTLVQIDASFIAPDGPALAQKLYDAKRRSPDEQLEISRQVQTEADKIPIVRWGYRTGSGFGVNMIASAFVHEGWMHLIGNMLFLFLAGSALEDRYGRIRFALFYVLGAVVATYVFDASYRGPPTILVGASGAISAAMGAFLVHFGRTRIRFWYWYFRATGTFYMPAYAALPLWLGEQVLWAALARSENVAGGVAYMAHIGGFGFGVLAGLASMKLFPRDGKTDDDVPAELPRAQAKVVPPPRAATDGLLEARIRQCHAAVAAGELATVRTLASRVILDLARADDEARVLELYRAIAEQLERVPLTDGAYAAAVAAADHAHDLALYVAIAEALFAEHPGSARVPPVMWRLAELYRDNGNVELATQTLRAIAARFPQHPLGVQAAAALG